MGLTAETQRQGAGCGGPENALLGLGSEVSRPLHVLRPSPRSRSCLPRSCPSGWHCQGSCRWALGRAGASRLCAAFRKELTAEARELKGELYCLPCHDKMGVPICGACRRPIEGRVVNALGKQWHVEVSELRREGACSRPVPPQAEWRHQPAPSLRILPGASSSVCIGTPPSLPPSPSCGGLLEDSGVQG